MPTKPSDLKIFLHDYIGSIRIGNFMKMKHAVLSQQMGKPESIGIIYTRQQFLDLLSLVLNNNSTGLRVYFASYPDTPNPHLIPKGQEGLLTLIYAPTKLNGTIEEDTGDYLVKDANGNIVNLKNNIAAAKLWVANYQNNKLPLLNAMLATFGQAETESIWYDRGKIEELNTFLLNAQGDNSDVPDILSVCFATYHLKEMSTDNLINYQHKLTLLIEFMNVFNYQGTEYYYYENNTKNDPVLKLLGGTEDTGVPCPPIPPPQTKCPGALP